MAIILTKVNHFALLLARAIVANYARHQKTIYMNSSRLTSYVNRTCINGSCRVLCKPRPELTQSVQKQIVK